MSNIPPNLIIPFAKPTGITSFTSLWQIKHALSTAKLGHTGTLDSFADGLLIVLSGKLTKLAPYITNCHKTYRVYCVFGEETDTLDPLGTVIATKPLPIAQEFLAILSQFHGRIEQTPPLYSAVKQNGQRLSDRVRRGESVQVKPRSVYIDAIQVEKLLYSDETHTRIESAFLSVRCSKGTYIRSLIRDIAHACGSVAYVQALRRTAIGPFTLGQAIGKEALKDFEECLAHPCVTDAGDPSAGYVYPITKDAVMSAAFTLTPKLCHVLRFQSVNIIESYYSAFVTGKYIAPTWFEEEDVLADGQPIAVFFQQVCIGLIAKHARYYSYIAVFGERL
ncbi:MAG: tRNA pseudouridine(55) synthase TruB [Treponema sp.]